MAITRTYIGKAQYDFGIDGGAISAIDLASNFSLPIGAMVIGAWTDVKTAMTSEGSATVALAIGGVTIKAATDMDDGAYTAIDAHLARTSAALTTAAGALSFTVAIAALTAGKVDIYVEYILAD